jgi:DNA-binding transcriptional ArsR family regulator
MAKRDESRAERAAAVGLLRTLRRVGLAIGVRHSGIAFDVGLLLYEHAVSEPPQALSVDMIAAETGYSGPTVRLVLKRLIEAGAVEPGTRLGKTQLYAMTGRGLSGFNAYVEAVLAFRNGSPFSLEAAPAPDRGRRAGPARTPGRYADERPDPEEDP